MFRISRLKSLLVPNLKAASLHKNYCYYLLLPEEPVETTENNALLRMAEGGAPEFDNLTAPQCHNGMGRICLDYESGIHHIEDQIKAVREEVSFANVLTACDELDAPLNVGWSTAKILYTARMDVLSQNAYMSLHERARKARVHKYKSLPIYDACKDIMEKETLDEAQERVVKKFLLEARLNGIELDANSAEGLRDLISMCEKQKNTFKEKLSISNSQFRSEIKVEETVKDFPEDLLASMWKKDAEEPTWVVSLTPQVYGRFLEYCPRRTLRWNAWEAHNMRCSKALNELLDTSKEVMEIRDYRNRQALFLGYANYAEMSMETKMAGRLDNVYNMITVLMNEAIPRQTKDIAELFEFAKKEDGFLDKCLLPYDVPYYSRLQRNAVCGDLEELRPFLPLPHVLETLLMLSSRLFGVDFEEVGDPKGLWHEHVRYVNILDSSTGTPIATVFLDLDSRPDTKLNTALTEGGGYVVALNNKSAMSKYPSVAIVHALPPPHTEDQPSLLSLQDVQGLFQKFGEALQQLLTEVPHGEVSGSNNLEWDAVGTTGHFMANWVYVPSVLKSLTCHHETGQPISDEHLNAVIASANHMAAHKLCTHLYMANLDLMLNETVSFWRNIVMELYPRYMPFPFSPKDHHVLSMPQWGEGPGAVYYTGTWSRMVAADCTAAFLEVPEEEWDTVGKRYRETFLALGGACHSAEVFRRFRGRDPLPEYLISLYDINK